MNNIPPFHFAFKIKNVEETRNFYVNTLGCEEGRSGDTWVDFNFFGHQISAHLSDDHAELDYCGKVDGVSVPIPHFGCLLEEVVFGRVQESLEEVGTEFIVKPQVRFKGEKSEQKTMFVLDPSGNPLEFKSFRNADGIYHSEDTSACAST